MSRKKFLTVASIALLVGGLGSLLWHFELCALDDASCRGLSETQLYDRLGNPTERFKGSFGNPPVDFLAGRRNIETMTWKRLSGTLYVSVSDESGTKVCFDAAWLPRGAVF